MRRSVQNSSSLQYEVQVTVYMQLVAVHTMHTAWVRSGREGDSTGSRSLVRQRGAAVTRRPDSDFFAFLL